MKSVLFILVVSLLSQLTMSCASTQLTQEQKDILLAFEDIYNAYKTDFILDDAQIYKVKEGDTLAAITRRIYGAGNGYYFPLIVLASSDVILDPEFLEPGMELKIPSLQENLDDQDIRETLKYFLYDIADVYEKKEAIEIQEYKKQQAANLKIRLRYQADSL
jgi:hypothetical protein